MIAIQNIFASSAMLYGENNYELNYKDVYQTYLGTKFFVPIPSTYL